MNHYPNREQVQALRERYPPGTMIQLTADMQGERFRAGDIGKVTSVDDAGQIHLAWLKGGSLAIIPGVDSFREIIAEPLDLNPYLENGNLRINGYYVDACTDNGIERADTLGKIEIGGQTVVKKKPKQIVAVMSGCLKPYFHFVLWCGAVLDSLQQAVEPIHCIGDSEHIHQDFPLRTENEAIMLTLLRHSG